MEVDLTEEIIKTFVEERQKHFDEISAWWEKYYEMGVSETERRKRFAEQRGLNPNQNIEQQIADWRWKDGKRKTENQEKRSQP